MRIHVISTINGKKNEGMRNIATHIATALEEENEVSYSSLNDFGSIIKNARRSDAVLVFARANKKVFVLLRLLGLLGANVLFFAVQPLGADFLALNQRVSLKMNCFYISAPDVEGLRLKGGKCLPLSLGIDSAQFAPASAEKAAQLKEKYNISKKKPVVLHVGHLSKGRALEKLLTLCPEFEVVIVASGLFENAAVKSAVENSGATLINKYIENIAELYQLADVYAFLTQGSEFVISLPLSVMEALSCGVPVLAHRSLEARLPEGFAAEGAIHFADDDSDLLLKARSLLGKKSGASLLTNPVDWAQTGKYVLQCLETEI